MRGYFMKSTKHLLLILTLTASLAPMQAMSFLRNFGFKRAQAAFSPIPLNEIKQKPSLPKRIIKNAKLVSAWYLGIGTTLFARETYAQAQHNFNRDRELQNKGQKVIHINLGSILTSPINFLFCPEYRAMILYGTPFEVKKVLKRHQDEADAYRKKQDQERAQAERINQLNAKLTKVRQEFEDLKNSNDPDKEKEKAKRLLQKIDELMKETKSERKKQKDE